MRLVDRVKNDVLRDRIGVIVKIEDMIMQSQMRWHGHVIHRDFKSSIREVMELEKTGKMKKIPQKEIVGIVYKKRIWNDMA